MIRTRQVATATLALMALAVPLPTIAADPSPAPGAFICNDETTDCAGPIAAGDHATVHFDRPFTFTLADDQWTNTNDRYRAYELRSARAPDSEFIIWSHAAPEAQTADCSPAREPGYGVMTADWLDYLAHNPGLDVSEPTTTDLGGRTLTSVEVTVQPTWTAVCEGNSDPAVLLVTDTEDPPTRSHLHGPGDPAYMGFIDIGDEAVVIWVDTVPGVSYAGMQALVQPVIESIRFTDPAPASPQPSVSAAP
jgi:hypothetical protein